MPFPQVFQLVSRTFLWIILFSAETIAPVVYMNIPGNYWIYIALIAVAGVQFLAFSYLKDERTVRDMRDLCIYEGIANSIGLLVFLKGTDPSDVLIVVLGALLFLKYGRLLWKGKSENGTYFVAWPVFGALGWYAKRLQRDNDETSSLPTTMQARQFYVFLILCITLGVVLPRLGITVASWHVAVVTLTFAPFIAKRTLADMKRQHTAYLKSLNDAADERAQADMQRQIAAEKEFSNQLLAAKNAEIQALLTEREKDKALLEKFNEALRDAAHDLQHPMAIVRIHSNVLMEMPESDLLDKEKRGSAVQKLDDALDEMHDMIDATVHSAQVVTGIIEPEVRVVDMDALFKKFQSLWFNGPNRQGLDYLFTSPSWHTGLYCPADLLILKRIVRNLMANAIQHSPSGKGVLVCLRRRNGQCLIQVRDSGPGIPEGFGPDSRANFLAFAERIRNEGSQVKQSGKRTGYRLGMNNVLQLCIATGWEMHLCARPERGSMFAFTLPLATTEQFIETKRIEMALEIEWAEIRALMRARGDLPMPEGDFFPQDDDLDYHGIKPTWPEDITKNWPKDESEEDKPTFH